MAEGVLFSFAGEILSRLSSQAVQQLGMLIGVKDDLNKLKSYVSAIQAVLTDAEERPVKTNSLKDWLHKLGEALYDADDVLDEFSTEALRRQVMTRGKHAKEVRIFFSTSNQLAFNYRMSRKMKKIKGRLDEISEEKKNLKLIKKIEPKIQYDGLTHRMGTHSAFIQEEVVGREDDKMYVKSLLLDDTDHHNISFIAIVGMGGIGKTTLAKLLYNDPQLSKHFNLKMWVWVSDQFDVTRVVGKIIESASGSKSELQELDPLGQKLQELIKVKKYLLVMDDVWNESDEKWKHLKSLLMKGARGSKILISKRNSKVPVEVERITKLINLNGLTPDSSWSLFKKLAFKEDKPNMNQLGKEILEKCNGVPLVIRHIGCLLYTKFSEEEWISFKECELSRVTQESNDITDILALSYKILPPHLKQCFAYSSLCPKNYRIKKDLLLRQWVAHGFVQSREGSKSTEDIANDYYMELCWRFFYEHQDDDYVHMHDAMRDLATMVATGVGYVFENLKDIGERTHHISLYYRNKTKTPSESLIPSELLKAKGLRTLHTSLDYSDTVVIDKLISKFVRLRVLSLNGGKFNRVPDFLKKLKHLRYLDLSMNLNLQFLPSFISELVNLQTLNLQGCKGLTQLPRDMNKLINLRYLDLSKNLNLQFLPSSISELVNLQTLNLNECKSLTQLPRDMNKLVNLRYLDISNNWNLRSLPNFISELINLQTLNLNECRRLKELPRDMNKLVNLSHLHLRGTSVTHMPKGIGKLSCLQTLDVFVLGKNKKGSKVSELNELKNLKGELCIRGLEHLRGNPSEARLANLKDKNGLRELYMDWKEDDGLNDETILEGLELHTYVDFVVIERSNDEESEDDGLNDETILEGLQLHPNVELAGIWRYKGEGLPNWMSNPAWKLTQITLYSCNRLQRLPQFHQLPALKTLVLIELRSLKFMDKNNPGSSTSMFFPSLEDLTLMKMPNLEGWWEGESKVIEKTRDLLPQFARPTRLWITDCPKLRWRREEQSLQELPNFPRFRGDDEESSDVEQLSSNEMSRRRGNQYTSL